MLFQARHMWAIARKVKSDHNTFTYGVAVGLADMIAANSSGFKRDMFMRECGWEHKPDDADAAAAVAA